MTTSTMNTHVEVKSIISMAKTASSLGFVESKANTSVSMNTKHMTNILSGPPGREDNKCWVGVGGGGEGG